MPTRRYPCSHPFAGVSVAKATSSCGEDASNGVVSDESDCILICRQALRQSRICLNQLYRWLSELQISKARQWPAGNVSRQRTMNEPAHSSPSVHVIIEIMARWMALGRLDQRDTSRCNSWFPAVPAPSVPDSVPPACGRCCFRGTIGAASSPVSPTCRFPRHPRNRHPHSRSKSHGRY